MAKHVSWMWLLGCALGMGTAHADVIYDVTLTSTQGTGQHTGTITLSQAPPSTGTVIYQIAHPLVYSGHTPGYDITAFNFYGYSLAYLRTDLDQALVDSTDGTLDFFFNFPSPGNSRNSQTFSLRTNVYSYSSVSFSGSFPEFFNDAGTVTITPEGSAVTPEPSSVALLGTGLVGLAVLSRRRFAIG